MEQIRVLLVDSIHEVKTTVSSMLANVEYITLVGEADTLEEALVKLEEHEVHVVIVGAEVSEDGYKAAGKITQEYSDIAVIMVDEALNEDTLHKAIFSGTKDIVIYPFTASKLVESIYRSHESLKKKALIRKGSSTKVKRKKELGQVITVFSTKGGVGKTFISTNLAIALKNQTDKRVALVDLDLDFGNTSLALNILPKYTLTDVVEDIRNIDQDLIESYMIPHESGISLLPTSAKPQIQKFVNEDHVGILLHALQNYYDYIVVDMPTRLYSPGSPALVIADTLLLVVTPEISALRNIKTLLIMLKDLNYTQSKIKIILNRAETTGKIKAKDIETTLDQEIFVSIREDYKAALTSLNEGIPVALNAKNRGLSKDFMNLARKLTGNVGHPQYSKASHSKSKTLMALSKNKEDSQNV